MSHVMEQMLLLLLLSIGSTRGRYCGQAHRSHPPVWPRLRGACDVSVLQLKTATSLLMMLLPIMLHSWPEIRFVSAWESAVYMTVSDSGWSSACFKSKA